MVFTKTLPICIKCGRTFGTPNDLAIHHSMPCEPVTPLPPEKPPTKKAQPVITDKVCRICGRLLPIGKFYPYGSNGDGYSNYCIDCGEKRKKLFRQKVVT